MVECFRNFANEQDFVNQISGIDVMDTTSTMPQVFRDSYNYANCDFGSNSLYICHNRTDTIPTYLKGWKEVALVEGRYVEVFRIRWAKTEFNPVVDAPTANKTNYFHVPEEDLIEFPGFVYHCHFLHHEDHEMMRPIMMQPSQAWKDMNNFTSSNNVWFDSYDKINEDLRCGYNNPMRWRIPDPNKPNADLRRRI